MADNFKLGAGWATNDPSKSIILHGYFATSGRQTGYWKIPSDSNANKSNTNNYTPPNGQKLIIRGIYLTSSGGSNDYGISLAYDNQQRNADAVFIAGDGGTRQDLIGHGESASIENTPIYMSMVTSNPGGRQSLDFWRNMYLDCGAGFTNGRYLYSTLQSGGSTLIIAIVGEEVDV